MVETVIVTQEVEATPVETIHVVTPTPEPEGPRTLVICQGTEPDSLFPYSARTLASRQIREAIAEGAYSAFDDNSYAYQPVILEKLPSLSDGDAILEVVTVGEGDTVVDADGNIVVLDTDADPPIRLIPAGSVESVIYQGGEFQMDQLSATFKLLPDLLWSDGEPLTAADSVYAFNLSVEGDKLGVFQIERTASYEAIDDQTTVWTGLPGYQNTTYFVHFFGPAPEHAWGQYSKEELFEAMKSDLKPIGWGPYVIDEWVRGESITLHKNPNYFRAAEGLPRFDALIYRFVGDNASASIAALLSGECDILAQSTVLEAQSQLLLDLQAEGQLNVTFATGTVWEQISFGIQPREYDDGYQLGVDRPDFFSDVRTRQAFAMCIDRQAIVDEVLLGQSIVIDSYLPPQHPLYNPEVRRYEFDVLAGSALLEEVGWVDEDGDPGTPRVAQGVPNVPDGTLLEVSYETTNGSLRQQIAPMVKASLARCGIQVNIQYKSPPDFFADGPEGPIYGRRFELGQFAWLTGAAIPCAIYLSNVVTGPAGETWVSVQDGVERTFGVNGWDYWNYPGFANEEYDAACNAGYYSLPDMPEHAAAHKEAQRIFAEQLPVVPLFLRTKLAATRPDMCGFIMDPTNNSEFWNIEEFDYGEGCEDRE